MKEFVHRMLFDCTTFWKQPYGRRRRLYQRRPVLPIVWLGVSLVAPEKPYPKEAYPTNRLTPKKGRQDNPSKSCIIEEERFSKSRRFLCVKNGYFLVFAGIPTWGYLWPIACPLLLIRWGKAEEEEKPFRMYPPTQNVEGIISKSPKR